MELYTDVSSELAGVMARRYSTSFSLASKLYPKHIRRHIYNIYGWVRIADEIVDSYKGKDSKDLLADFHSHSLNALKTGYSTNPIIQAFADTARAFDINRSEIDPFIKSMLMDINPPKRMDRRTYERYIYGSAEVVGLMCLKIFCNGDSKKFDQLKVGACALGSAFQKVNFLRDYADDRERLGRSYFPEVGKIELDDVAKNAIIEDISKDFAVAKDYIAQLPYSSRRAVYLAYLYYLRLLKSLTKAPAELIRKKRIRVSNMAKIFLFLRVMVQSIFWSRS